MAQIRNVTAVIFLLKSVVFCHSLHVIGSFETDEFFKFIVKFGFQKTERHFQRDSFGYIYGNITSQDSFALPLTLAVLDKHRFLEFYGDRSNLDRDAACRNMFSRLNDLAYDRDCNLNAKVDFLREIPCRDGHLCIDEDSPLNVIPGNQFTYIIRDFFQPRFWYVSIVACYRNRTSCTWHYYDFNKFRSENNIKSQQSIPRLKYDFRLVNGSPNQSTFNPFAFHFSFDQQNIIEIYLLFLLVYMILVPLQLYAVSIQKHPVTKIFTLSLIIEFISVIFIVTHQTNFAINGVGNPNLQITGDILNVLSMTSFMIILLLLAKGWAVTRQQISTMGWLILMMIWIPYCIFHIFLYVWIKTEVDLVSDIGEYQTWPGWIVLACRTLFMLWFLWELRNTMKYEHSSKKLDFLLHFGASSLVWFIYLPIVAVVALQVSPMWRYKLLLGIKNSADCLANCIMTGLLWPNRSGQYLLLAGPNYRGMDELDEFNEAPHIVHGDFTSPQSSENEIQNVCSLLENCAVNGQVIDTNNSELNVNVSLLNSDNVDSSTMTDFTKNSNFIS